MPAQYRLLESGDRRLLESGDDRLLESSTVDQSVALPVIDDASLFGPSVAGAGLINLPLIDDGATLPPLVFEDKAIALPLVDDSTVLAPTVTLSGDIELPLIDDSSAFGPAVFVEQTAALPLIDGGETFGPTFVQAQQLDLRFLDGGWPFGPTVTGQVVAGLAVYVGTTMLEPVTTPTFRDPIDDIGSFTVTLANDDADLALCDFDAILRFEVDGLPVFSGIIRKREIVHLAAGEEHDHVTALSGPGYLGIGFRDVIYPSRGLRSLPIELVRSLAWPSVDFDDSGWPLAKKVNRQREYATWRSPLPHIWPDTTAWWIAPNRSDFTSVNAPTGAHLYRKTFTLAADATVRIYGAGDNSLVAYLDGAPITEGRSFTEGQYIEMELSAGTHLIAARGNNYAKATLPNPTGIIMAAFEVGDSGLLVGDPVFNTDATWRCIYIGSDPPPGFNPGEALHLLKAETDIFDGTTFDFTETQDSAGQPWAEFPEITVKVGRTYTEVLRELAAAGIIDVAAAPGASVIRAWNYGTRGRLRSKSLNQTPGDPNASEFLQLRHHGEAARLNKALILDAEGWTEKRDQDSIDEHGTAGGFVEMGAVQSHEQAEAMTGTLIEGRAEPVYATTARLLPSTVGPQPYRDFENGDTLPCLDENGDLTVMRMRAITLDSDEVGVLEWGVELRELVVEAEELQQNALRRAADGQLVGGARITSPAGSPTPSQRQITALDVSEFSMHAVDGDLPTGLGIARRAVRSGNVVEIAVTLTLVEGETVTSGATSVRVYLNGGVLGSLITIDAGSDEGELPVARVAVRANVDRLRPELVSVADEVAGVDITVRAL